MTQVSLFAAVLVLWVSVCPAAAQAVTGPAGASGGLFGGHRPVDPNRVSQRLSLNVDLSGGYDSHDENQSPLPDNPDAVFRPSYGGTAQTGVRYWRGKTNRFFEATGRGSVNYEAVIREQLISGEALVQGTSSLGRKLQVAGGALFAYDPATLTNQFGPGLGEPGAELALDHPPPNGVTQQQWFSGTAHVNALQTWSVRQSTVVEYRHSRRAPAEGDGIENRSQAASMRHTWNFHPSAGVLLSYRLDDNREVNQSVASEPLRTSTIDVGLRMARRFSPIRTLNLEIAGGAALAERVGSVEMAGLDYVLPVVSGSLRFNLTGVWSVFLEANRNISVLEGVTPEPFATTAGTLQLNAVLTGRTSFGLSGVYSRGEGLETSSHGFEAGQAQAQLQYGFARCCGTFTSYSFYRHHTRDLTSLPANFPERYGRHTVRVGFTFWLPLYGSF